MNNVSKVVCECPKCGGTGVIPAFGHILNGDCFKCGGTGKVACRASKSTIAKPLTEYQLQQVAMIETGDLSKLGYVQLARLRDFAHWPLPQRPHLLTVWRERGDEHFFRAQEERLTEFYANR